MMKTKFKKSYSFKTFVLLFLTMLICFSFFSVYVYSNSKKVIESEFINSNAKTLSQLADYIDQSVHDCQYALVSLEANPVVHNALFLNSDYIYVNYTNQLFDALKAIKSSNTAVHSIYIYSEFTNQIYGTTGHSSASTHFDRYWIDMINLNEQGYSFFPYASRNQYPYCICIAKTFTLHGKPHIAAIMLDISELPLVKDIQSDGGQHALIISDQLEILYQKNQSSATVPLSDSEFDAFFNSEVSGKSAIYSDSQQMSYCFSQQKSELFPWSYALHTALPDYTNKLSTSRALAGSICCILIFFAAAFSVFFGIRTLKPLKAIRNLLDNPVLVSSEDSSTYSEELKYIADKITQYVQTNEELANQLDSRLHLLNEAKKQTLQTQINPHFLFNTLGLLQTSAIDSLGYDHDLPSIIQSLSSLLRYSLEPSYMVSLEEEIKHCEIYLTILNHRYDKALTVTKDISNNVLPAKVPRMFIQPIIENAVFHGFSKYQTNDCTLGIRCLIQEPEAGVENHLGKRVCIQITDNGIGIRQEALIQLKQSLFDSNISNGKNIGLRNIAQRLDLSFPGEATIDISSTPNEGTCFTITFPFIY